MALVKLANRFPISPDLIGPWDALLSFLKVSGNVQGLEAMRRAVQGAKQQAVLLNNMIQALQNGTQAGMTDLTDLTERIAALEDVPSAAGLRYFEETPDGTMNSSNAIFTLTVAPVLLILSLNGQSLVPGGNDYTLSVQSLLYVPGKIPAATDAHYAWGLY